MEKDCCTAAIFIFGKKKTTSLAGVFLFTKNENAWGAPIFFHYIFPLSVSTLIVRNSLAI